MSVLIWSMVAAKAKSGYSAASSGDSKTVGSYLKQASSLILMIMLASGFNIYAQQLETEQVAKPMLASSKKPTLRSGPTDSHYGGGVASYALDHFATLSDDAFRTKSA